MFQIPITPLGNRPHSPDKWVIQQSAVDNLYARKLIKGYLIVADGSGSGEWFFRFKKFSVTLDATPSRHMHYLARL
jgi:hypothetical protein